MHEYVNFAKKRLQKIHQKKYKEAAGRSEYDLVDEEVSLQSLHRFLPFQMSSSSLLNIQRRQWEQERLEEIVEIDER